MTPYQTLQTLLANRPMRVQTIQSATGMSRTALYRILKELVYDQGTIRRVSAGLYAAVPAATAAPRRAGKKAGIQGACLVQSQGVGRGHQRAIRGNGRSAGARNDCRVPDADETALSEAEVAFAWRVGA